MKGLAGKKRAEFDRMLELLRAGKLNQWPREVIRAWCKARLGVEVSERHFRRITNQTKS